MNTQEKCEAVVIFRKFFCRTPGEDRKTAGDVIALFPELPWSCDGHECTSYQHVGQHGGADPAIVHRVTVPATEAEYAPLKRELESIGYVLTVRKRQTPKMRAARYAEARRVRS